MDVLASESVEMSEPQRPKDRPQDKGVGFCCIYESQNPINAIPEMELPSERERGREKET